MHVNQTLFPLQSWSFDNVQYVDLLSNQTIICPIDSNWIYLEEYFFTSIGLLITGLLTIKIHLTERRFHDYHALIRYHLLSFSLICLFLTSFLFNTHPKETTCKYEQILLQYSSVILLSTIFLMSLLRRMKNLLIKKIYFIGLLLLISLTLQTLLTTIWISRTKKTPVSFHYRTCVHRIQLDFCLHARTPFLFSIVLLPIIFFLNTWNIYRFTKPFAIAEFLESIISSIGLILSGSMWSMNLLFSTHPQMPYRYVAYVFLLTYMFPR